MNVPLDVRCPICRVPWVRVQGNDWAPNCDCGGCLSRKDGRHDWMDGADICAACGCSWEDRHPEPEVDR